MRASRSVPPVASAPAGNGGVAGAVTAWAPGQAASMARSIMPGGTVPGTHTLIVMTGPGPGVLEPDVGLAVPQPGPRGAQQPGQVPPQRLPAGRVRQRRRQHGDHPGIRGEGGVLAPPQPRPAQQLR